LASTMRISFHQTYCPIANPHRETTITKHPAKNALINLLKKELSSALSHGEYTRLQPQLCPLPLYQQLFDARRDNFREAKSRCIVTLVTCFTPPSTQCTFPCCSWAHTLDDGHHDSRSNITSLSVGSIASDLRTGTQRIASA
jgi:hypothetical protein